MERDSIDTGAFLDEPLDGFQIAGRFTHRQQCRHARKVPAHRFERDHACATLNEELRDFQVAKFTSE